MLEQPKFGKKTSLILPTKCGIWYMAIFGDSREDGFFVLHCHIMDHDLSTAKPPWLESLENKERMALSLLEQMAKDCIGLSDQCTQLMRLQRCQLDC